MPLLEPLSLKAGLVRPVFLVDCSAGFLGGVFYMRIYLHTHTYAYIYIYIYFNTHQMYIGTVQTHWHRARRASRSVVQKELSKGGTAFA